VTVGSLDDPQALAPTAHIWTRHSLPWLSMDDGLPRHADFPPIP